MPLIAHNDLPSYQRLREEGRMVMDSDRALTQDIRELHIGLLNLMQDSALEATERQFLRLVGESNKIAQFYVHPFTLPELPRGGAAKAHIAKYYKTFEEIKAEGLDALIITGTNVKGQDLSQEIFWKPFQEVLDWAYENVTSTICSCLATHALMQGRYNVTRSPMNTKKWGVYKSRVRDRSHPIVRNMNTVFDVQHSRWNDISRDDFEKAGLHVLVNSFEGGAHAAVSEDLFRFVCFQGHPEYDTITLLKEYKRDVGFFIAGELQDYPPFPEHYLSNDAKKILTAYRDDVLSGKTTEPFPEDTVIPHIENTWADSARSMIGNWVATVYQVTHMDRKIPFMDGIDPRNPLGLLS